MKLQRFFVHPFLNEPIGDRRDVALSDEGLLHQLKHVFRLHAGDSVILLDNTGIQYVCEIVSLEKKEGVFRVKDKVDVAAAHTPGRPNMSQIVLFQSMPKKDKFEYVLEKGTEIGVSEFVPVLSDRSEKHGLNTARCQKILIEASEQSERGTVPVLSEMTSLADVLNSRDGRPSDTRSDTLFVALHLNGEQWTVGQRDVLCAEAQKTGKKIGLLIGPEGGWTDTELALFASSGVKIFSVGAQVLRTETAAIVAAALMLLS